MFDAWLWMSLFFFCLKSYNLSNLSKAFSLEEIFNKILIYIDSSMLSYVLIKALCCYGIKPF